MISLESTAQHVVTEAERKQFHEQGYLVVENLLPPTETKQLKAELVALLERQVDDRTIGDFLQDQWATQWGVFSHHLWPDGHGELINALPDYQPAKAIASQLLGTEAKGTKTSAQVMYPNCGCKQPWHQDSTPGISDLWWINCMYYVDDMTEENGSTLILPGTHREPLTRRMQDYGPLPGSVRVTCPAGSAVFFYMCVLHAADENRSADTRFGIKTHYHLPEIDPFPDNPSGAAHMSRGIRRGNGPILDCPNDETSYWFAD